MAHEPGTPASPQGISRGTKLAIAAMLGLVLVMGACNLLATYLYVQGDKHAQQAQQKQQAKQGQVIERKLCTTFGSLAANNPPAGDPATNPSRAYDQRNAQILGQVPGDIDCPHGR